MEFFLILLLSVPFFYIWGFISFIKYISGGNKNANHADYTNDRKAYLETAIAELKKTFTEKHDIKVEDLLHTYEHELKKLTEHQQIAQEKEQHVEPSVFNVMSPGEAESETKSVPKQKDEPAQTSSPEPKHHPHAAPSFQNWYKDNSINLLLYIGAFLIVLSATIYVGLDAVSGVSKGFVLSATTLLFFFSGLWFYKMPKVKNAGSAFAAIGALLIPISGLGWYNFVFKFTDVNQGVVWLVTSIVGLFAYIVLARYFRSAFYSYVTSFSTLSFAYAFVNMQGLQNDLYVLASIISSILLLGVSIYFRENKNEDTGIFLEPFSLTANIVMPVSILYGIVLVSETTMFTLPATLSVLLGSFFYAMCYVYFKKPWYVLAAQVLFSLGLLYFANWLNLSSIHTVYLLTASIYLDIYFIHYFQKRNNTKEALMMTWLIVIKTFFIFVFSLSLDMAPLQMLFLEIIFIIIGILLALVRNNVYFAGFCAAFLAFAFATITNELLNFSDKEYILGMVFSITGTGWYLAAVRFKAYPKAVHIFGIISFFYLLLSTALSADNWGYQLFNALIICAICYSGYKIFARREFLYGGSIAFSFAIWCLSEFLHLHDKPYLLGILYTIVAALWYAACVRYKHRPELLESFTFASAINFLIAFVVLFTSSYTGYQLLYSLILALVCFSASVEFKKKEFLYAVSLILLYSAWSTSDFFQWGDKPYLLGMIYLIAGTLWYYGCVHYKSRIEFLKPFAFASICDFVLSAFILFNAPYEGYQLLLTIALAIIFFSAASEFMRPDLLYFSNGFIFFSVWNAMRFLHIEASYAPLAFMAITYVLYLLSSMVYREQKDIYRNSALVSAISIPAFYGLTSFSSSYYSYGITNDTELYALISAFAAFVLYGFDAYSRNSSKIGYIASVIGLVTYMWQIHFIGITETQYYTLAIGLYFLGLSYFQRKKADQSLKKLFDSIGMFFLIVPTWTQSFGDNGMMYALILGLVGVSLLAYGITYTEKWYRYAGILAIVLAVTSQSKWAIIGLAGLGFLGLALYLLIFRKEENPKA